MASLLENSWVSIPESEINYDDSYLDKIRDIYPTMSENFLKKLATKALNFKGDLLKTLENGKVFFSETNLSCDESLVLNELVAENVLEKKKKLYFLAFSFRSTI